MSVTDQLEASLPDGPQPATTGPRKKSVWQFEITAKKVPRKELMHFSRQLAVFIKAGIPILDALEVIQEELGHKYFKTIVGEIVSDLRGGSTFADAVARHADAFPPYYIGILHSAELTGRLDTVLVQLSDYLEREVEARRMISSALTYPIVIAFMAVVVVIVLVSFVMPRFKKFFTDLHARLPLPTRMLLATSDFLTTWWFAFVGGALIVAIFLVVALRTQRGRSARDSLFLKLPVVGDLVQHVVLERFCRILSSMMGAGVPLPEALRVTTEATSNEVYKRRLADARDAMLRGEGLAGPLAATGLFPASARQMFKVGENTGTLDDQLETAAVFFERELEYKIKRFTNLFEPVVIVAMGVVVGFVAVALVSAMYGIFNQVNVA
jgi:type IV pilus assembly protein PilC